MLYAQDDEENMTAQVTEPTPTAPAALQFTAPPVRHEIHRAAGVSWPCRVRPYTTQEGTYAGRRVWVTRFESNGAVAMEYRGGREAGVFQYATEAADLPALLARLAERCTYYESPEYHAGMLAETARWGSE